MTRSELEIVPKKYHNISEIPMDENIFYHCLNCDGIIPSLPDESVGCACGKVFIDKDYWRLIVDDLDAFEVMRRIKK
jgi:hypothetical protein